VKHFLLIVVFYFFCGPLFSQEGEVIDGIRHKLKSYSKNDSVKVELVLDLAWEYSFYDFRKSLSHCDEAIALSRKIGYESGVASALSMKGNNYRALSMYDSAYYFLNQSLKIRKKQNRKTKIAAVLQNIANVYNQEGNVPEAAAMYNEALKTAEESGDKKLELVVATNLAAMYGTSGFPKKAVEVLNRAFAINKVLKDEHQETFLYSTLATLQEEQGNIKEAIKNGLKALELVQKQKDYQQEAAVKSNLATYYRASGDHEKASQYYQEAVEVYAKLQDSLSMAKVYNNFAMECLSVHQPDLALLSSFKSLRIAKKEEDTVLYYNTLLTIADAYTQKKDFKQALAYAMEAKPLVEKIGIRKNLKEMYASLSDLYISMKDYKSATEALVKLMQNTDSMNLESNNQLVANVGVEMGLFAKEKEIELLNKNAEIKEIELNRQKNIRWLLVGIVFLFGVIGIIVLGAYRRIKKSNVIIENQKLEVELKNEEVIHQKEIVEEKQKEIIDSINYARRIQMAVLTGEDVWNKVSREHFILFKPKDIVSGDFYWAYNTPNNRSVFALADCTGHGVPGGFMSMLGNSFLNEIVVENKIFKASEILNKLRSKIINALEQKGGAQQKDGMDISLCVWNKIDNTLEFAGANNPLWLLRGKELMEYKADKMPIGLYLETEVPFSGSTIQLEKGDIIYLSTDGYADQFGGPKGKKLKYKPLIESIIRNSIADMTTQKINLETSFNEWKGNHEQVDDVSLIGVKVI
jgi:serine phosphatase RsbU (regulator of sigma subunit)/phosphotransferase system IIB component